MSGSHHTEGKSGIESSQLCYDSKHILRHGGGVAPGSVFYRDSVTAAIIKVYMVGAYRCSGDKTAF